MDDTNKVSNEDNEDEVEDDYYANDIKVTDDLTEFEHLEMSELQNFQDIKGYEEKEKVISDEVEENLSFNKMKAVIEEERDEAQEEKLEEEEEEETDKQREEVPEETKEIGHKILPLDERLHMITQLKELMEERKILKLKNGFLQKKYYDTILNHKVTNILEKFPSPLETYKDERYQAVLKQYEQSKEYIEGKKLHYETEIEKMKEVYAACQSSFEKVFHKLISLVLEVGTNTISNKTGKRLETREIEKILEKQKIRAADLANMRFIYLKQRNRLANINARLDVFNKLPMGCTIMDYERLAVQKRLAIDKLEEKEGDLQKYKRTCFAFVSILGHMNECIDTLMSDNVIAAANLAVLTESLAIQRFNCVEEKQERDNLRKDIVKLRERMDLLLYSTSLNKMKLGLQKRYKKG